MALMRVEGLTVDVRVRDISVTLDEGGVLGLIGPNGSGKSTLLNAIAGIQPADGHVLLDGLRLDHLPPRQRACLVGLQPQTVDSAWSLRVRDVVALGRMPWQDEDAVFIEEAMSQAGIAALAKRKVDELSGGERARVWLARVLAGQPRVLLVDEPIANLDLHYQLQVMHLLRNYAREGKGVVIALHDLSLAARYCDRLCLLSRGRAVAQGPPGQVLTAPLLSETYGIGVHVDLQADPPVVLPR